MSKITQKQQEALDKLSDEWQNSYNLGCNLNILYALVKKGLVKQKRSRGYFSMPRICIYFKLDCSGGN